MPQVPRFLHLGSLWAILLQQTSLQRWKRESIDSVSLSAFYYRSVFNQLTDLAHEQREIDLLVFEEVLSLVSRVDRVLSSPGGSLLLAGRAGVGRRSLASLVANMHQMKLLAPKVTRGYGLKQFKADLKQVCSQLEW